MAATDVTDAAVGARARLPRNTLSREVIVGQAIELIERDGAHALTIGALARQLGSAPGAIYRHVSGREELIAAISDEFFRLALSTYDPTGDWEADLAALGMSLWTASDEHPALAAVCSSRASLGEMESAAIDAILSCVAAAGWTGRDAALRYWTFASFILGTSALRANRVLTGENPRRFVDRIADSERFPHLHTSADEVRGVTDLDAYRLGLQTVIDAMRR